MLKISASSLLLNHYLIVESDGLRFSDTSFGRPREFRYSEVDCALMSSEYRLSLQVGNEVFSIPTDPEDEKHQKAIAALVNELQRDRERSTAG